MRTASLALMTAAAIHLVGITSPAYAQVQPVPYSTSQPVPYNPAPAQPTPPPTNAPTTTAPTGGINDIIHLKNGGLLRGTIVDVIPGSHARIQLPTGEIAMVQWSEIARIENTGAKPTTTAPTTTSVPTSSGPPPLVGPKLLVHIESSRPVRLERFHTTRNSWDEVCSSPCDVQVPVEGDYRVAGSGVRTSGRFTMQGKAGDRVVIEVSAASKGWFAAGIVGVSLGGLTIVVGLIVVAVGAATNSLDSFGGSCSAGTSSNGCSSSSTSGHDGDATKAAGWTITGVGALAVTLGIIAIVSNSSSGTSQEVQEPVTSPKNDGAAARRDPMWRTDDIARAMPKQIGYVPVFTKSF